MRVNVEVEFMVKLPKSSTFDPVAVVGAFPVISSTEEPLSVKLPLIVSVGLALPDEAPPVIASRALLMSTSPATVREELVFEVLLNNRNSRVLFPVVFTVRFPLIAVMLPFKSTNELN